MRWSRGCGRGDVKVRVDGDQEGVLSMDVWGRQVQCALVEGDGFTSMSSAATDSPKVVSVGAMMLS